MACAKRGKKKRLNGLRQKRKEVPREVERLAPKDRKKR